MRYLGVDGLGPVSRVGPGTWQFGSRAWGYGNAYADRAARDIVHRARELGVTLFDTAEIYAFGRSQVVSPASSSRSRRSRPSSDSGWRAAVPGSACRGSRCTRCTSPIRSCRTR
jgi:hypothetical protein